MLFSYGSLVGHEIVFGHHTSAEVNCHGNDSSCCDHHGDQQNHLPCLVDINPHFVSSQDVFIPSDMAFELDLGFYFLADLLYNDYLSEDIQEVPPDRVVPEDYSLLFYRSHGLRGPPIA